MDSREFTEWAAFLRREPDLGTRIDYNLSVLASVMGWKPQFGQSRMIEWGR
jgi:hypothetical protein